MNTKKFTQSLKNQTLMSFHIDLLNHVCMVNRNISIIAGRTSHHINIKFHTRFVLILFGWYAIILFHFLSILSCNYWSFRKYSMKANWELVRTDSGWTRYNYKYCQSCVHPHLILATHCAIINFCIKWDIEWHLSWKK